METDTAGNWVIYIRSNAAASSASGATDTLTSFKFTKLKQNVDIFCVGGGGGGGTFSGNNYCGGGGGGSGKTTVAKNKTITVGTAYTPRIGIGG